MFLDQFVDQATLLDFISMCDVYVTPYLNEAQMTSGTLAYSFGLGKAVVSTPYWHARELLADGRGILVPFGDAAAIGSEIAALLTDDARRQAMRVRAYADSRSMTWERIARALSCASSKRARRSHRLQVIARPDKISHRHATAMRRPDMQIGHFLSMCDDTGLFQHAVHSVPDRSHGYCVDDNARALLLACALNTPGEQRLPEVADGAAGRLRSACLESRHEAVSQLHELRSTLARGQRLGRQPWAHALGLGRMRAQRCQPVAAALGRLLCSPRRCRPRRAFSSPRAWAFTLLGLDAYCAAVPRRCCARARCGALLADRLMSHSGGGRNAGLGLVRGRSCL